MTYIGIDPGQKGGLVSICQGKILSAIAMPSSERDIADWFQQFENREADNQMVKAVIERVHSMPKQGVASSFQFGKGYGFLRGCLISSGIAFEDIPPQTWMKSLHIPSVKGSSKGEQKEKLRAKAQQLFPALPLWKELKSKGKQLAIADALLLAHYCQRRNEGKL